MATTTNKAKPTTTAATTTMAIAIAAVKAVPVAATEAPVLWLSLPSPCSLMTTTCCQPKLTDLPPLLPAQSLVRLLPVAIVVTPAVPPHHPNVVHPYRRRRRRRRHRRLLTPAFVVRLPSTRSSYNGHHRDIDRTVSRRPETSVDQQTTMTMTTTTSCSIVTHTTAAGGIPDHFHGHRRRMGASTIIVDTDVI